MKSTTQKSPISFQIDLNLLSDNKVFTLQFGFSGIKLRSIIDLNFGFLTANLLIDM